jgi:hypothetical protein
MRFNLEGRILRYNLITVLEHKRWKQLGQKELEFLYIFLILKQ